MVQSLFALTVPSLDFEVLNSRSSEFHCYLFPIPIVNWDVFSETPFHMQLSQEEHTQFRFYKISINVISIE